MLISLSPGEVPLLCSHCESINSAGVQTTTTSLIHQNIVGGALYIVLLQCQGPYICLHMLQTLQQILQEISLISF